MNQPEHEAWFAPGGGVGAVEGFLTPVSARVMSELLTFQLDQGIRGNLVEIGTYFGKTFVGLVKAARNDELTIGLDIFPDYIAAGFKRSLENLNSDQKLRVLAIRANTATLSTLDYINTVKAPARFIHIDGDHTYSAIVSDLHLASSYLAPKAIVVLDDFLHDWYPDLTEGIIDALKASRNIVPVAIIPRLGPVQSGGTKLVCASKDSVEMYSDMLMKRFSDKRPQLRKLAGHNVLAFQGF